MALQPLTALLHFFPLVHVTRPLSHDLFLKMYTKAALLALALVAPLACATIALQQPQAVNSNSPLTIKWTSTDPQDPQTFSLELANINFHNAYAVANNVLTSQGSITITLPTVPEGDNYTLQAVNITNIGDIYSQTGSFSVGAPISSSSSSSTNTGTSAGVTTRPVLASSSAFGTTVGASATTVPAVGSSASLSSSQTSTATGSSSSGFNGAMSQYATSFTTLALSAFAGIALLTL